MPAERLSAGTIGSISKKLAVSEVSWPAGSYAVNPANRERIPIWVADYVLGSYGSGAIMAVPAHDARDHEFARVFNLPIRRVVSAGSSEEDQLPYASEPSSSPLACTEARLVACRHAPGTRFAQAATRPALVPAGPGVACASSSSDTGLALDGLSTAEAKQRTIDWLQASRAGQRQVNYKLRDWLFARQRYWGEPFPVSYPEGASVSTVWAPQSLGKACLCHQPRASPR